MPASTAAPMLGRTEGLTEALEEEVPVALQEAEWLAARWLVARLEAHPVVRRQVDPRRVVLRLADRRLVAPRLVVLRQADPRQVARRRVAPQLEGRRRAAVEVANLRWAVAVQAPVG